MEAVKDQILDDLVVKVLIPCHELTPKS